MSLSRHILVLLCLLWAGCASYSLKEASSSGELRTLTIDPVVNESYAPQVISLLTRDLRDSFIREGSVRLVDGDRRSDARLRVRVVDYRESFVSGRDEDAGRPASLALDMTVAVELDSTSAAIRDRIPNDWRFTESVPVYAEPSIRDGASMHLPALTQKISRRVRDAVLSPWDPENANR